MCFFTLFLFLFVNLLPYIIWIVNPKSDRNYKVQVFLNSAGDRYPSVPCSRMLLNQCT